jgi:hypothetical protein
MNESTPQDQGFALEFLIHTALKHCHALQCLREQDIRTMYNDQSMNGVDHWIICGLDNILIQDKWKEVVTQHEVTQFLHCVERIKKRCDSEANFFLIWACKHLPSAHALTTLREAGVSILNCPISIQSLARLVVLDVCEWIGIDPTESLKTILVQKRARDPNTKLHSEVPLKSCLKRSSTPHPQIKVSEDPVETTALPLPVTEPAPSAPIRVPLPPKLIRQPVVPYDETEDGKNAKQILEGHIRSIQHGPLRKLDNAQRGTTIPDIWRIVSNAFPQDPLQWSITRFKKIDFNAFLKTVKSISVPDSRKKYNSHTYFFYVKLRKISIELSELATQYNALRDSMIEHKSAWAKTLPSLRCNAEPMSEEEYKSTVRFCEDYLTKVWSRGGGYDLQPSGLQYQFYQHYNG